LGIVESNAAAESRSGKRVRIEQHSVSRQKLLAQRYGALRETRVEEKVGFPRSSHHQEQWSANVRQR